MSGPANDRCLKLQVGPEDKHRRPDAERDRCQHRSDQDVIRRRASGQPASLLQNSPGIPSLYLVQLPTSVAPLVLGMRGRLLVDW